MGIIWHGGPMRAARKEAGLTQFELGEKVGVSSKTIERWERTGGPLATAQAIAAALGCELGGLLKWGLDPEKVRFYLDGTGDVMSDEEWSEFSESLR